MRLASRFCALVLALWLAGFAWFSFVVTQPPATPTTADGIVALTGGAERVATALRLLAQDRGRVLLISGVARGTDLAELAHGAPALTSLTARITLGHAATTTRGNAEETRDWARAHGLRSLIVVTAGYHMPRALLELRRAMPEVALSPLPVTPPALQGGAGLVGLRVLAAEYTKLLAAWAGLAGWHAGVRMATQASGHITRLQGT